MPNIRVSHLTVISPKVANREHHIFYWAFGASFKCIFFFCLVRVALELMVVSSYFSAVLTSGS